MREPLAGSWSYQSPLTPLNRPRIRAGSADCAKSPSFFLSGALPAYYKPPQEDWDGNSRVGSFLGYDGYGWSDERGLAWVEGLRILSSC